MSVLSLMRPEIVKLQAYSSARSELAQMQGNFTWLDANENPWEPFPGLPETKSYNRYPDPQPESLLNSFSQLYDVPKDCLLVTRGSDEGIDLILRMFCRAGKDSILTCSPTYAYYRVAADIQGAKVMEIPSDKNFQIRVDAIAKACKQNVKLVMLCSPNNPTANLLKRADILKLCKKLDGKAVVVVDEAYLEFSKAQSLADQVIKYPNLVVLRTLSKAHGLAGVRCGVTIASPSIIEISQRVIAPYPIPVPTVQAVTKALSPEGIDFSKQYIAKLIQERERMRKALAAHPDVVKIYPSDANFLLVKTKNATEFLKHCRSYNIIVRDRSVDVHNCVRITIGTEEENNRLLEILGLRKKAKTSKARKATVSRRTNETSITVSVDLDRAGKNQIDTGIDFFDHMLEQIARHGGFSLSLRCHGDLQVDSHHSIEDCGLALGEALKKALGNKKGISRYGFLLPMDESLAQAAIDISGRPYFKFVGKIPPIMVGEFQAEMTSHFFKSLSDSLAASIHLKVEGENTHHMIEACFKAVGRALRMAFRVEGNQLPSTKGVL
jgi:histidinol-phosphate aminotransferase